MAGEDIVVSDNRERSRFEARVDGHVAAVDYELEPGRIVFTHTEVPEELGGRGIAGRLARAALDHARAAGLKVVPRCSYMASFIRKNAEYQDLVAE